MKKIFTLLLLGTAATLAANADIVVKYDGNTVNNGSTIYVDITKTETVLPGVTIVEYSAEPEITFVGTVYSTVTLTATSDVTNGALSICWPLNCQNFDANNATRTASAEITDSEAQDIQLHYLAKSEEAHIAPATVKVVLSSDDDEEDDVAFTVVFQDEGAGLQGVDANAPAVKVQGSALTYNVLTETTLTVYNIAGRAVVSTTVNGNGAVSLSDLPAGIYIYRLDKLSGKFIR